jgi:hypothetical protein
VAFDNAASEALFEFCEATMYRGLVYAEHLRGRQGAAFAGECEEVP